MPYEKSLGAPQIDKDEHIELNGVHAKRVLAAGYDGTNLQDLKVATDGSLFMNSGMNIPEHDEVVLGYTGSNLTNVVYKLATVTVATLTLSYTGANLTGVVKT